MPPQRPSGLCTQEYYCPKGCGWVTFQRPGAVVEHPCSKARKVIAMKEKKS